MTWHGIGKHKWLLQPHLAHLVSTARAQRQNVTPDPSRRCMTPQNAPADHIHCNVHANRCFCTSPSVGLPFTCLNELIQKDAGIMVPFLTHLRCNWRIGHVYRAAGSLLRSASLQTRNFVQDRPMVQPSETEAPVYCSYPLDRAAHLRTEEAQATLRQGDNASLILVNNGAALCMKTAQTATTQPADEGIPGVGLASISPARLFVDQCWLEQVVFLGIDQTGSPVYAGHTNSEDITLPDGFENAVWLDIRKNSTSMCAGDAALAGTANGLLQWHKTNIFSEDTGEHAAAIDAGWARKSMSSTRYLTYHILVRIMKCTPSNSHKAFVRQHACHAQPSFHQKNFESRSLLA